MTDWDQLREVGHQVSPPSFESLVSTAHQRSRRTRVLVVTAVVALVTGAGIGLGLVDLDEDDRVQPAEDTSPDQTPTEETTLRDGVLPLPDYDAAVDAGRYHVPLSDTLAFEVDLPEQSSANGGGLYLVSEEIVLKVEIAGRRYGVPSDPCRSPHDIVPAGSTVADLVAAIRSQPIIRASRPEPVELDGARGQYLETRVPAGYDSLSCEDSQVGMPGNPDTSNNVQPGYIVRWWILDVDGQRVVVAPGCGPCDAGASERMERLVHSITFITTP